MYDYEIFADLLAAKGLTAYQVYKATGVAQSTLSDWKNGKSRPKADKLAKIAEYFGVTVEYLMTGEAHDGYYVNPETAEVAQKIFENKELRLLFDAAQDASPEDLLTVHQMLLALKRKERPEYDDPA